MKYYVMPKNAAGESQVFSGNEVPVNMEGVVVVDLPNGDYLHVISKGKEYPAFKVATAVARGQIKLEDIRA